VNPKEVPRTRPEGLECDLDAKEESAKLYRVAIIERVSLRVGVNSLVISWLGMGVARVIRMNASEPMVGWMQLVIDKYSHTV
jgi:hypothetical protein